MIYIEVLNEISTVKNHLYKRCYVLNSSAGCIG